MATREIDYDRKAGKVNRSLTLNDREVRESKRLADQATAYINDPRVYC